MNGPKAGGTAHFQFVCTKYIPSIDRSFCPESFRNPSLPRLWTVHFRLDHPLSADRLFLVLFHFSTLNDSALSTSSPTQPYQPFHGFESKLLMAQPYVNSQEIHILVKFTKRETPFKFFTFLLMISYLLTVVLSNCLSK